MVPSCAMRTHVLIFALASVFACASDTRRAPSVPSARQNVMPLKPASLPRRETSVCVMVMSRLPAGALDGGDDAVVGAAPADVAVHVRDDVGAARLGIGLQKLGRLHDLARLAVAALRHLLGDPGF